MPDSFLLSKMPDQGFGIFVLPAVFYMGEAADYLRKMTSFGLYLKQPAKRVWSERLARVYPIGSVRTSRTPVSAKFTPVWRRHHLGQAGAGSDQRAISMA
jgi:hypothetical protein